MMFSTNYTAVIRFHLTSGFWVRLDTQHSDNVVGCLTVIFTKGYCYKGLLLWIKAEDWWRRVNYRLFDIENLKISPLLFSSKLRRISHAYIMTIVPWLTLANVNFWLANHCNSTSKYFSIKNGPFLLHIHGKAREIRPAENRPSCPLVSTRSNL